MKMSPCPGCGEQNSVRRESCYRCGAPLVAETGDGVAAGHPARAKVKDGWGPDEIWYVVGAAGAVWVVFGPAKEVLQSLTIAAIAIGAAVGTLVREAFRQSFPDRDIRLIQVIASVAAAWIAWQIVISLRGGW